MNKKWKYLCVGFLLAPSAVLYGGTYRPKDGILSFLVVLGFLLAILGILQLKDYIKARFQDYIDGVMDGLTPE